MSGLISRQAVLDLLQMKYSGKELYKAIYDLPSAFEGMTNGEIIKALFPNVGTNFSNVLDLNLWWNAPFKAESEE